MGCSLVFRLSHSAFVYLMSSLMFVCHYLSLPLVCLFCRMWNANVSVPDHSLQFVTLRLLESFRVARRH